MTTNNITCPQCQAEFEVSQVIKAQLADDIRSELQADYSAKLQKLGAERDTLAKERKAIEASQAEFDERLRSAVSKERDSLTSKLRVEAQQAVAVEIADRDEQLKATQTKLKEFESQELELRRKTRELEQKAEQQELEVARKLDQEKKAIREATLKQADETASLKLAERDQKIGVLADQLKEAQRKLEQGSQQIQGDVQEVALEAILGEMFPADVIERVGKGEGAATYCIMCSTAAAASADLSSGSPCAPRRGTTTGSAKRSTISRPPRLPLRAS